MNVRAHVLKSGDLRRALGLVDAVGVGLGAIIGAGIFVVLGIAANAAGPALIVSLALAGGAAACNALSSAQLAAVYPQSGGTYEYGYRVLHPVLGYAAGWVFLVSKLAAGATVALGLGAYAAGILPRVAQTAGGMVAGPTVDSRIESLTAPGPLWSLDRLIALGAVVLLTLANWRGIRKVGRLNTIIVAVTVAALGVFIAAGLPSWSASRFEPFAPNGAEGVLRASALLFFAFTGYARLATLGEEVRDPERTIPRAIGLTIVAALALYLAVAVVAVGSAGTETLGASPSPLAAAAGTFHFRGATWAVSVGAATAMLGVLLSQILGISRMLFAMGRRGDLPSTLSAVDPHSGVPRRAVLLTGAAIGALALFGTLAVVARSAAFAILLYYAITNLAALRLASDARRYPRWIAVLGLSSCLLLAASLDLWTIASGLALLAVGLLWRWLFRARPGASPVAQ